MGSIYTKHRVSEKNVPGIQTTMQTRHFLGDAMIVVSTNIIFNIVGMITYFYTDIMGIAAGVVGTVLLVARFADAFTDIGMGVIVDRTKSKYGKARPWLIRMAVPSLICIVLLFTVPPETSNGFKIAYIMVTNLLMTALVYTAIAVPAGSLMSLETKDPLERAKMSVWRMFFAYAAGMSVSIFLVPAANGLGGDQKAWIIIGALFGAVSAVALCAAFFSIRENNIVQLREEDEKLPLLKGIAFLFRNKYWLIGLAVNILINVTYAFGSGATVYYAKYILGDENLVAPIGFINLIFIFLGLTLTGLFVKKTGKRNIMLIGAAIAVFGFILRTVNPYHYVYNLITMGICALGSVPVLAVIGAIIADTIEYGEWKTGKRTVGLASSANSFGAKLGGGLWAGAAGWLLALGGYDGTLSVQTAMANQMILALNIYVPLLCYAAIFALMIFYRLDKDYNRIITELEARRLNN